MEAGAALSTGGCPPPEGYVGMGALSYRLSNQSWYFRQTIYRFFVIIKVKCWTTVQCIINPVTVATILLNKAKQNVFLPKADSAMAPVTLCESCCRLLVPFSLLAVTNIPSMVVKKTVISRLQAQQTQSQSHFFHSCDRVASPWHSPQHQSPFHCHHWAHTLHFERVNAREARSSYLPHLIEMCNVCMMQLVSVVGCCF